MTTRVWIATLVCCALAVGCKKKAPQVSEEDQRQAEAEAKAELGKADQLLNDEKHEHEEAKEEAEEKVRVTPALVQKYEAFLKDYNPSLKAAIASLRKTAEKTNDAKSTAAALEGVADVNAITEKFKQEEERARKAAGLSEDELEEVREVVTSVITQRALLAKTSMEETLDPLREQVAKAQGDQKKAMQEQLSQLEENFEKMKRSSDAREKFGDAAVDAVIAREGTLRPLQQETMEIALQGMK